MAVLRVASYVAANYVIRNTDTSNGIYKCKAIGAPREDETERGREGERERVR